ncbi:MAG: carboxypeptidase regulatory-like domain-containing protein [Planctomycetota bacterium]
MNRKRGAIAVALLLLLLLAFVTLDGSGPGSGDDPVRRPEDGTSDSPPDAVPADRPPASDDETLAEILAGPNPFEHDESDDPTKGDLLVEVRREDGTRVLGATVLVDGAEKKTDEEGCVLFAGIEPAARYEIHAVGPDFYDVPGVGRTGVSAGCRSEIRIVLKRGGAVRGTLVTPDGQPLVVESPIFVQRGSLLLLGIDSRYLALAWARSSSDGHFVIGGVLPGTAYVVATPEFFTRGISRPVEVRTGETRDGVEIVVRPAGRIAGRIVERETGKPLFNLGVTVSEAGVGAVRVVRSDVDGEFRIDGLRPGRYGLVATDRGRGSTSRAGILVEAGRETGGQILKIGAGGRIRGRIANPAPDRRIRIFREHPGLPDSEWPEGNALQYPDGTFKATVEPGTWIVRLVDLSGCNHAEGRALVIEGEETLVTLQAVADSREGAVSGRVVDRRGRPVPDATVQLVNHDRGAGSSFGQTDANGEFALHGERPGIWRARALGNGGMGVSAEFTLGEKGGVEGLRIVLAAQTPIQIRVKHGSGSPARHIFLTLRSADGHQAVRRAANDALCRLHLTPGSWTVYVGRPDRESGLGQPVTTIEVKPGGTQTFEVVID